MRARDRDLSRDSLAARACTPYLTFRQFLAIEIVLAAIDGRTRKPGDPRDHRKPAPAGRSHLARREHPPPAFVKLRADHVPAIANRIFIDHAIHTSVRLDPESRRPESTRRTPAHRNSLIVRGGLMGHALMENRNGLVVDACLTEANGHAERIAALHMIEPRADRPRPITLGADRGYDAEDFVNELRSMKATPHVAQNTSGRSSAVDGRTTRHAGYAVSQRIRKRIEETFGWIKTVAGQERTKFRGRERVGWAFTFAAAAYNLARLPKLLEAPA